jgi:hypothetical protein
MNNLEQINTDAQSFDLAQQIFDLAKTETGRNAILNILRYEDFMGSELLKIEGTIYDPISRKYFIEMDIHNKLQQDYKKLQDKVNNE